MEHLKTRFMVLAFLLLWASGVGLCAQDVWNGSVADEFAGGSGTEADPYLISNGAELAKLANDVNGDTDYSGKYFKLTKDIVLNNTEGWETWNEKTENLNVWTPIGEESKEFEGTFDGNGHTVSGIYCNSSENYQGLFGNISGTVRNVGVINGYIKGGGKVGGVCGISYGTIEYCCNTATVSGVSPVGGVCGQCEVGKTINYCYNTGTISGTGRVGGICGYANSTAEINNCYNTGGVSGLYRGGIFGERYSSVSSENCYYLDDGSGLPATGDGSQSGITSKSADEFKNGSVCWQLNGSKSGGVWKQTLNSEDSPTFSGETIYPIYEGCNPNPVSFTNSQDASNEPTDHIYDDNGICSVCRNAYQPAKKNADGVYEIGNTGQLYWFAALVNGTVQTDEEPVEIDAVLTADITVNENVLNADGTLNGEPELKWIPIGRYSVNSMAFYYGEFDGRGHTVSGLYGDSDEDAVMGLFGLNAGTVKNVGIADSYFKIVDYGFGLGGVCGGNLGMIENSYSTGSLSGGTESVLGGVCGYNDGGTIKNCYWLDGTCAAGVGTDAGTSENVASKTADEFKSGAVAYLLQNGQTEQVWGQKIGVDDYPSPIYGADAKVYEYKLYRGSDDASVAYANDGMTIETDGGNNAVAVFEEEFTPAEGCNNVVVRSADGGNVCASLVLTDGADFYSPVAFTASRAEYSRKLSADSRWATLVLPFGVQSFEGGSLYDVDGVVAGDAGVDYLAAVGMESMPEACTPVLVKGDVAGGEISFVSEAPVQVAATDGAALTKVVGGGCSMTGSFAAIENLPEGSMFISRDMFWSVGTEVGVGMKAFRVYISVPAGNGAKQMRIIEGGTTDIEAALAGEVSEVDVYSVQGTVVRRGVERPHALDNLPAGIYIVGGEKVIKR